MLYCIVSQCCVGCGMQLVDAPLSSLISCSRQPSHLTFSTATTHSHGDGHEFSLERVDRDNANLFDLECDGGMDADPLLISITRQGSNRDGLTVDRRGGRYSGGDCQPNNRDKTWSSNLF